MKTEQARITKPGWLWDYEIDEPTFVKILNGELVMFDHLDWRWAMARLIDYAPYRDVRRLLPVARFLEHWPEIAPRVRAKSCREGMDFVHGWLLEQRRAAA